MTYVSEILFKIVTLSYANRNRAKLGVPDTNDGRRQVKTRFACRKWKQLQVCHSQGESERTEAQMMSSSERLRDCARVREFAYLDVVQWFIRTATFFRKMPGCSPVHNHRHSRETNRERERETEGRGGVVRSISYTQA